MINFASQVGKTLGATYGGNIIPNGRKRVFIWFNIMAIASQILMQYVNIYTLSIGKFLNGFFVTVVHIANIKMINETVPVYLLGKFGTVVQGLISMGYFVVLSLGYFLPSGDYDPEIKNDPMN